jgi:hypothetical protein
MARCITHRCNLIYTFTLKMTARHAPKRYFQPTKLNGIIAQNIIMQNPQFITSCRHNRLQPFSSLAILNSLNKQKLVKWEQQGVSRKQQGTDINSCVSVLLTCEPQFYCLLHCSSKLLSSSANRVVKMENAGEWQSCRYNSVKCVCVCMHACISTTYPTIS